MRKSSTQTKALALGVFALAATLLWATSAFAAPTSADTTTVAAVGSQDSAINTSANDDTKAFQKELTLRQAQLRDLKSQLASMDVQAEIAGEQHNQASDQLKALKSRVKAAQTDLESARRAYAIQSEILGQRATSIYKDGEFNGFEVLLDSKSLGDFVSRVKFLNTVGLADASSADSAKAQKEQMEAQLIDLKNAAVQAEALEFELKAREIEVKLSIEDRQKTLANAQSDLVAMLDSEAARRQLDQEALLAEIYSGASKAGIVVAPGTPVETALAYHGVPYVWAGADPSGFDCSGLMLYVFEQHGVILPHYSGSQFQMGEKIDRADIMPNDVVFFGSPVHHVGMYCGGGYFIEAPFTGSSVRITKLSSRDDIAGFRRYPWTLRVGEPKGAVSNASKALKTVR
jgi:peptidoglycan DL-endopeptidase CwlO